MLTVTCFDPPAVNIPGSVVTVGEPIEVHGYTETVKETDHTLQLKGNKYDNQIRIEEV